MAKIPQVATNGLRAGSATPTRTASGRQGAEITHKHLLKLYLNVSSWTLKTRKVK